MNMNTIKDVRDYISYVILILLVLALVEGCGEILPVKEDPVEFDISGTIVNSEDFSPAIGIEVWFYRSRRTTSNNQVRYESSITENIRLVQTDSNGSFRIRARISSPDCFNWNYRLIAGLRGAGTAKLVSCSDKSQQFALLLKNSITVGTDQ